MVVESYLIVGTVLVMIFAIMVVGRGSVGGYSSEAVWLSKDPLEQLQCGNRVVCRGTTYTLAGYERLGTTSVAPAYRFALQGASGDLCWLFVQTAGSLTGAWLLKATPYEQPVPNAYTSEIVFRQMVWNDAVWGASTRYLPEDRPCGSLRYGRYFLDYAKSMTHDTGLSAGQRHMLAFEWENDSMLTVYYGTALDLDSIEVQV